MKCIMYVHPERGGREITGKRKNPWRPLGERPQDPSPPMEPDQEDPEAAERGLETFRDRPGTIQAMTLITDSGSSAMS